MPIAAAISTVTNVMIRLFMFVNLILYFGRISHSIATMLLKFFQGAVVLYFVTEPAGTWSVAFSMGELLNALLFVSGTFSA